MLAVLTELLATIARTSPIGALIAAAIVALALVLIVYARTAGLFDDRENAKQKTDFQGNLLAAIKLLTDGERDLRLENAGLREDIARLLVQIDLVRTQNRRIIDLLRDVVEGRLAPAAIVIPPEIGAST